MTFAAALQEESQMAKAWRDLQIEEHRFTDVH